MGKYDTNSDWDIFWKEKEDMRKVSKAVSLQTIHDRAITDLRHLYKGVTDKELERIYNKYHKKGGVS